MINDSIDDFETLANGLECHYSKFPNSFHSFGTSAGWIVYDSPHKRVEIVVHVDKDYVYVSWNKDSTIFSASRLIGWHPWHRNTKRYYNSYIKLKKIVNMVNTGTPELCDLFPELAQNKLEEAIWGKKDE